MSEKEWMIGENVATLTLVEVSWLSWLCLPSRETAEYRWTGRSRKREGKSRRGEGGVWGPSLHLPLLAVTFSTLLEFHKSLRRSRKWLPGFGMLFPGRCRHSWILCFLPHPQPSPPLCQPPFFSSLPLSHPSVSLPCHRNTFCGKYFYYFVSLF